MKYFIDISKTMIYAVNKDDELIVFSNDDGTVLSTFSFPKGLMNCYINSIDVAFVPFSTKALVFTTIFIYSVDVYTGENKLFFQLDTDGPFIEVIPLIDSKFAIRYRKKIRVYDESGVIHTINGNTMSFGSPPDGSILVYQMKDSSEIELLDIGTMAVISRIQNEKATESEIVFSLDGSHFVTLNRSASLLDGGYRFMINSVYGSSLTIPVDDEVATFAISPNGRLIGYSQMEGDQITIIDIQNNERTSFAVSCRVIEAIHFINNDELAILMNGMISVYNVTTQKPIRSFRVGKTTVDFRVSEMNAVVLL
jgi:hypothetical protein